jgi:type IX secretion system PorP/SprF family membrane protein
MDKIKFFLVLFSILFSLNTNAQEPFQQFNYLNYNAAYAGSENNMAFVPIQMKRLYPYLPNNETDYIGSIEFRVNKINSAFAYQCQNELFYNDRKTFHSNFMYNYEIKIKEKIKLRLGIQLSKITESYGAINSFVYDVNSFHQIYINSPDQSFTYYSIDPGIWLNFNKLYMGLSTINLTEPEYKLYNYFQIKNFRTYNLITGYKFEFDKFNFTPSILCNFLKDGYHINLSTLFTYKNIINFGLTDDFYNQTYSMNPYIKNTYGIIAGVELLKKIQLMGSCKFDKNTSSGTTEYFPEYSFIIKFKLGLDKKWF